VNIRWTGACGKVLRAEAAVSTGSVTTLIMYGMLSVTTSRASSSLLGGRVASVRRALTPRKSGGHRVRICSPMSLSSNSRAGAAGTDAARVAGVLLRAFAGLAVQPVERHVFAVLQAVHS